MHLVTSNLIAEKKRGRLGQMNRALLKNEGTSVPVLQNEGHALRRVPNFQLGIIETDYYIEGCLGIIEGVFFMGIIEGGGSAYLGFSVDLQPAVSSKFP